MAITLPAETEKALVASIQHYFRTERDEEIGDLRASFFLQFVLEEIGPSVYNQAVRDAQAALQNAVADLDATVYEPEPDHTKEPRTAGPPARRR
jgi:uncharacterized protein (DUF2164 family)